MRYEKGNKRKGDGQAYFFDLGFNDVFVCVCEGVDVEEKSLPTATTN